MATTTLEIVNGKIIDYSDRYFYSLSEDGKQYSGNGWDVTIQGRPQWSSRQNNLPCRKSLFLRAGGLPP